MFQVSLKKLFSLKTLEPMFHGHMFFVILKANKLLECFSKKKTQKANQKEFRLEKVIKRNCDKLYAKWKG